MRIIILTFCDAAASAAVVLDQLARLEAEKDRLSEAEHDGLKKLCLDNNEDIFVYFEEYVEKSGPVFQNKLNEAYKAFVRFGRKAKDVFARSKYGKQKKKTAKTTNVRTNHPIPCMPILPGLACTLAYIHTSKIVIYIGCKWDPFGDSAVCRWYRPRH